MKKLSWCITILLMQSVVVGLASLSLQTTKYVSWYIYCPLYFVLGFFYNYIESKVYIALNKVFK